jgi:hypothetical protein
MIGCAHVTRYSREAEVDREFLREMLGSTAVDSERRRSCSDDPRVAHSSGKTSAAPRVSHWRES